MNDYLAHYGIFGQKWGRRRFQNPDGTLTPEGKARYGRGTSIAGQDGERPRRTLNKEVFKPGKDGKSSMVEKSARAASDAISATRNIYNTGRKISKSQQRAETAAKERAAIKSMSDEELRKRINRLDMEKRYKQLSAEDISSGENTVNEILSIVGNLAAIGVSAATMATMVNQAKQH